jgi:hypothetical protein
MKVKEFFKAVDDARSLCEDLMEHDVSVRLVSRDGLIMSDHFDLARCSYMFSPWLTNEDGTKGSLVLEFKVN